MPTQPLICLLATLILHVTFLSSFLQAAPRTAVLDDALPQTDAAVVAALKDAVRAAGYDITPITAAELSDPPAFIAGKFDLLVVPNARTLPLSTIPTLTRFLESQGHLIACGLPAWDQLVIRTNGQWLTRQERQSLLDSTRPQHLLTTFANEDLSTWRRSSNIAEPPAKHELLTTPRGPALHVIVPKLTGWETFMKPYPAAFPPGHTLTCFRAKGAPNTKQMLVEWMEKDGSRWIATVNLTPQWKDYALPPEAFTAWQPPASRAGPRDHLRVENVQQFSIGLGISHGDLSPGHHEYYFANLGTAPNPLGSTPPSTDVPHLEMLSPAYLTYPVTGPTTIRTPDDQAFLDPISLAAPAELLALHPRPAATGFNKNRPYRWQTLLYAQAPDGDYRGAIAALVLPTQGQYRGSAWAAFTPTDAAFYRNPQIQSAIAQTAKAMHRGLFLQEGGAQYYTIFKDQPLPLGARVTQLNSSDPANLSVCISVIPRNAPTSPLYQRTFAIPTPGSKQSDDPGLRAFHDTLQLPPSTTPHLTVITELRQNESQVIDRLTHDLDIYHPTSPPHFIESRNGGFFLNGHPWKAHGVNYMPSSGIAQPNNSLFEQWLSSAAYDPQIIDRDLRRIKAMNLNSVSVFVYHASLKSQNLLDFLRRCQALDLKVNLSLRPGTPLDFQWPLIREMIQTLRLPENDTIFAYDLAWEPSHFDHKHQLRYAPAWQRWVLNRYGSLDAAQKVWQVPPPMDNGQLSIPPAEQLVQNGPWRKLIADYRAFLDDMLRTPYAEARRLVRSIDPNHAVSFRMQMSGDPTFNTPSLLPYDFYGLADAVDIWEPEAYGRIGDWDMVKPGHFTAAYARLCDPNKPVLWAEMGVSVWDNSSMSPNRGKLDFQAQYYRDFYRMMIQSGANGVFYWWYPAGYRVNEKSDYGIINADGTDRPVTRVIRTQAAPFLASPKPQGEPFPIPVNRDQDSRGLFGIYQSTHQSYWRALDSGQLPTLHWTRPPGEKP